MVKKNQQTVRVIAGALKGRRLEYPAGRTLRPTMERTRTSLFDSIGDRVRGASFVDLFAGAGGVGFEAISRGASLVHFVENQPEALALLHKNLAACGVPPKVFRVHPVDVFDFLENGTLSNPLIRIVFADPPYGDDFVGSILAHFEKNAYDHIESLIIEHRGPLEAEAGLRRVQIEKTRRFGDTFLTFLKPGT